MLKPLRERLNLVVEKRKVGERRRGQHQGKERLRCTEHD